MRQPSLLSASSGPNETVRWRNPVSLGELFCGAGGMTLGAAQAGRDGWEFEHRWVTDGDRDACETISQIVPAGRVRCADVTELDFSRLPPVDGLAFGFPCNDFSQVGKRQGVAGEHGGLYRWCVRGLEALEPRFFVAENVSGMGNTGGGSDFAKILNALETAGPGYEVSVGLYRFEQFGVPQKRWRYILVGWRRNLGVRFEHPPPTGERMTAGEALAGLPEDAANNERTRHSPLVVERLKHIRPGENIFQAALPEHLRFRMRSGATVSQLYRRLKADEPAYTVLGAGGGGTQMFHWDEPRGLTNRERARLQTFPDWFRFTGGRASVRRQIGNALPPVGAKAVFEAVLDAIARSAR